MKRGGVATVAAAFFKQILEFFNKITFEFLRDTVGNIMNKIINFLSKYKDIWLVKVVHHYFLIVKGILDGTLYNMQTYESEWKKLVAQIK